MKITKYILCILIAVLFLSCVDNPTGFFYSLEKESEIYDGMLDNNITVGSMVKNNDYYFIGSGKFRYRLIKDKVSWKDAAPAGLDNYLVQNLILLDDVYGIFYNPDEFDYRLYKADTSSISDKITWGKEIIIEDFQPGESIIDFQVSNDLVFFYTSTAAVPYEYSVYTAPLGTTELTDSTVLGPAEISGISSGGTFDVDYDGAAYWLISGNKLFSGTPGSMIENTDAAKASTELSRLGYGGILCDGTDVYLSTKEGIVLKYDGAPWESIDSGLEAPLYDFAKIDDGSTSILLLASSQGYYENNLGDAATGFISPKTAETLLTDKVQYSSIDLSKSALTGFFYDSAASKKNIFALGYNSGLWNNSIGDDSERSWDLE